ncbi:hypothetical protein TNIN_132841 [Trichonephila inaurata madagascariensis]|uniref:Uncharacterized protein n=1 Tax=Trichonephila inaurata madagascariensis TaxID=2747483 RepID=A0A8X7C1L7_9ARAC|nr:hypothetical protein TNIN_357651 [Trichonephila inaurata madagascariensis]GFY50522.1 hypothetical protein TNIN_132841 [Trichonephila inaurata madagascariensis]
MPLFARSDQTTQKLLDNMCGLRHAVRFSIQRTHLFYEAITGEIEVQGFSSYKHLDVYISLPGPVDILKNPQWQLTKGNTYFL